MTSFWFFTLTATCPGMFPGSGNMGPFFCFRCSLAIYKHACVCLTRGAIPTWLGVVTLRVFRSRGPCLVHTTAFREEVSLPLIHDVALPCTGGATSHTLLFWCNVGLLEFATSMAILEYFKIPMYHTLVLGMELLPFFSLLSNLAWHTFFLISDYLPLIILGIAPWEHWHVPWWSSSDLFGWDFRPVKPSCL